MSDEKKLPPPPVMPPSFKIKKDFCLFHKGPITEEIYKCSNCGQSYCLGCAKNAINEGKTCIKCKSPIFL